MYRALTILFLTLISPSLCVAAQQETTTKEVDSTLLTYYQWCTDNRANPDVLLKADTLLHLSAELGDERMECVAQTFKANYYYYTNNLDSLRAWIPRVQEFARAKEQLKYYYFVWTRLVLYYTKHGQYTLAQYELERYLAQARVDDFKSATADAYVHLANIFTLKRLHKVSADYYQKAIDYIEKNNLERFSLYMYYTSLASEYLNLDKYDLAAQALEKGEKVITRPEYIWQVKLAEVKLLTQLGETTKANKLLEEIKRNGSMQPPQILSAELALQRKRGEVDQAFATTTRLLEEYDKTSTGEHYKMSVYSVRSELYAKIGNYEAAYKELDYYQELYNKKVADEAESSLEEFATLLDVSRLDHEKAQLRQQAQDERLYRNRVTIVSMACILLLAAAFLTMQTISFLRLRRAKRAAEQANRMKTSFIHTITHEINTPLNAIVGFTELAAAAHPEDPERQSYIHIVQQNSDYLQKLVNDVLYISELESTNETPILAEVDIDRCVSQSIHLMENTALAAGIQVQFTPHGDGFTASTSALLIDRVLRELLLNATRFAGKNVVTIDYGLSANGRNLIFSIADNGPGIRAEDAERIFERFVKLDAFTQGLGLGLSVCRLIASSLKGDIRLDTSYTQGARFLFTITI